MDLKSSNTLNGPKTASECYIIYHCDAIKGHKKSWKTKIKIIQEKNSTASKQAWSIDTTYEHQNNKEQKASSVDKSTT